MSDQLTLTDMYWHYKTGSLYISLGFGLVLKTLTLLPNPIFLLVRLLMAIIDSIAASADRLYLYLVRWAQLPPCLVRLVQNIHCRLDDHTRLKCGRMLAVTYSKINWIDSSGILRCAQCFRSWANLDYYYFSKKIISFSLRLNLSAAWLDLADCRWVPAGRRKLILM